MRGREERKGWKDLFHVLRLTFHASPFASLKGKLITFHAYQISSLTLLILTPVLLWAQGERSEPQSEGSEGISITLREEVFLSVLVRSDRADYITLSDVADIECEDEATLGKLKSIKIGTVPIPGQSRFLSLDLLKMYLRNKLDLKDVKFLGAHGVKVFPKTIKISKELVLEQIENYAVQSLIAPIELSIELEGDFREFEVYKGQLAFEVSFQGSKLIAIRIKRDGKLERTLYLPIKMRIRGDFAVAKNAIPGKTVLAEGDMEIQQANIEGGLADLPISNLASLKGKRAKVSIRPGQVIRTSMVEEMPLVERGEVVTIVLQAPPLHISTVGRAEEEGIKGQTIKVINLSSRKMIYAEVVGENVVKASKERR